MTRIIDADTHFIEPLSMYQDYIGRERRHLAIHIEQDARGWPWLAFKGKRLHFIDDHLPGRLDRLGERRRRFHDGEPAVPSLAPPPAASDPAARIELMDRCGSDAAIVFPNLGLLWEDCLREDLPALRANFEAYNNWVLEHLADYSHRIFPAVQLTLRDLAWFEHELVRCAHAGIRLAMIAPSLVAGRSLADPDFDPAWSLLQDHAVAVCFHVSQIQRPLDPGWYAMDPEPLNKVLDNVFLYLAPAVAVTSLIIHGVLERFPRLRIGIVEQSARWVPEYLLHLDGGFGFYTLQNARPLTRLSMPPSAYFRRQVRVCALAAEGASELVARAGPDIFMWGSDYPHAEGMAEPSWLAYESTQPAALAPAAREALAGENAAFLLGL